MNVYSRKLYKIVNTKYLLICKYSNTNDTHIEHLKRIFEKYNKSNYYNEYAIKNNNIKVLKRASVLVPISHNKKTNTYDFTLTKRNDNLRTHTGQISFVGGMKDSTDIDDIHTAYREAKEEIGLDDKHLTFISQLIPICSSSGVIVTPIIAFLDNENFTPNINENEVDFIFNVQSDHFLMKKYHSFKQVGYKDHKFYVHYIDETLDDGKKVNIWGLTGFLSICVSTVLNGTSPEFDIDPHIKLDSSNLNEFLDYYLSVKSEMIINAYATKPKFVVDFIKKNASLLNNEK